MLTGIEDSVSSLPEDLISEVDKEMKELRNLVNTIGGTIEKYFKDQKSIQEMTKNTLLTMDKLEIYKGLSNEQKNAIVEKIIGDADLILIGPDELKDFIKDKLETDSAENLVKKAYSKRDIIHLGEAVSSDTSSEVVKYDAGLNVLREMVKTPTGRNDAIVHGIKRLMGNTVTLHYYLMLYYGMK